MHRRTVDFRPMIPPPAAADPRRTGLTIVAVAFALLCLVQWGTVVRVALGFDYEPRLLVLLKLLSGAAAYAAAVGTVRRRPWAAMASFVFGVVTAALILAVGPVVGLDAEERRGLLSGALSMLLIGTGLGLYLRSALRRRETTPSTAP